MSRLLRFSGIGESNLAEQVSDLLEGTNPTVAPYASLGDVKLRLTACASTSFEAEALLDPVEQDLRGRTGRSCYGRDDDSLASVVIGLLQDAKQTLSVAESCTGGGLGAAIQYDLRGEQTGPAAGLCAAPPESDSEALHQLAYWTEDAPSTLQLASIRERGGELEIVSEGEQEADGPISACAIGQDGAIAYTAPVLAAASLRRLGRETFVVSEGDGDLQVQIGDNEPATYDVVDGITVRVPQAPTAMAATGDARGGGYPGGVVVIGGSLSADDHRAVLIDPSRVTMTPIEIPSATE